VRVTTVEPLIYAGRGDFLAPVHCLTQEFGVDVNQKNGVGWNALLIAAEEGHLDVFRYLVNDYGANVIKIRVPG
jgi:ankyrin repeat protein